MNKNFLKKINFLKQKSFATKGSKTRKKIKFKTILIFAGYSCLGIVFVIAALFAWFSKDLPTPAKIANRKPTESTKIYDRTGQTLLYETGEEKRTVVKSDEISGYVKDATVSLEDANFYKHHGIEPKAILSALYGKLTGKTKVLRGGSTITQQYVKNALLTSDRSTSRKIKEAILAIELEFMYSKDEILTMYLNEIPYGNATAGAEAASRMYYGKSAKDLTIAETATLVSIPQSPTYYSPYGIHIDALIGRRNYVIDRMVKNGKISQADADEAKKQDTTTINIAIKPRKDSILAPHFAMYVMEQVVDKYGEDTIQKQGLKIITTLDYDKQRMAQDAITTGVPKLTKYGASNAALVSVDPKTGQILAMVGSKDYFDTSIDGNVNVADSLRQPGSSFKPIAYATAFKKPEYSPSKILYDFETDFGGNPPYIPHNYNGRSNGPVTMRQGLSNSLNIPAVKVMSLAGIDEVLTTAKDLGITSLNQRDRYGLSLVLGAGEVKPVEMAGAFSAFANGGVKHDLNPILKITDSGNKTLYEYDQSKDTGKTVLDPQIAYEISNILSDNNARSLVFGTRSSLYFPDRNIAAKTGTTSDFKDAWTVGYTPSLATAVWVGNSNATKMKNGADGSVVAGPIFHDYMVKALGNTPNEEFAKPDGIQELTVEKYSNKLPDTYSKETTTDIFASWQVPTNKDDLHKIINVCKGTNLVAPDNTPAGLIEQKVITDLHSERPDNPNWEGPVRNWAAGNGMISNDIPTGTCDLSTMTSTVQITSPINNTTITGPTTIIAGVQGNAKITKVEFFIDSVSIGEVSVSPFAKLYDFSSISEGNHKISVVSTDENNITSTNEITVIVKDNTSLTISNLNSTIENIPSTTLISATITWLTNKTSSSAISYYQEGFESQPLTQYLPNMTTAHTIAVSNLKKNTKYYYTVISVDTKGNSESQEGTFTTGQ